MSKCNYCVDEVCENADCLWVGDLCPVPDTPYVCIYEERDDYDD